MSELDMKRRIGELAEEARVELGLSRPVMAKRAGIAVGTLQRFELGQSWPQQTRLRKITDVLGWRPRAVQQAFDSGRAPESFTLADFRDDAWEGAPASRAAALTDDELLAELTYRFQSRSRELERLRAVPRPAVEDNVHTLPFNRDVPHAAHPPMRLEAEEHEGLGEEPQTDS